ncbi:hypothetical protein RRF57_012204 [Xylaria bambusicola]|uniref:Uncharacterized protein n=1 Tax=Xylaria bambusicola TaxID=326684 RepID=A0AAN7UUU5_9PEZI
MATWSSSSSPICMLSSRWRAILAPSRSSAHLAVPGLAGDIGESARWSCHWPRPDSPSYRLGCRGIGCRKAGLEVWVRAGAQRVIREAHGF